MNLLKSRFTRAALFASLVASIAPPSFAAALFGTNLIQNPGADAGTGSADGSVVAVPSWTPTTGAFTAVQYNASGGFPASTDSGPADRGANLFAGGTSDSSIARQVFTIASDFATVDLGTVTFVLSGYFGGFGSQDDNAVLNASFRTAGGTLLSGRSVGGVNAADRNNATGLLFRTISGVVPAGTREIDFDLVMTRLAGAYNDGYADSLSLVLTAPNISPPVGRVPEPAAVTLLGLGLAGLVVARRRRFIAR